MLPAAFDDLEFSALCELTRLDRELFGSIEIFQLVLSFRFLKPLCRLTVQDRRKHVGLLLFRGFDRS